MHPCCMGGLLGKQSSRLLQMEASRSNSFLWIGTIRTAVLWLCMPVKSNLMTGVTSVMTCHATTVLCCCWRCGALLVDDAKDACLWQCHVTEILFVLRGLSELGPAMQTACYMLLRLTPRSSFCLYKCAAGVFLLHDSLQCCTQTPPAIPTSLLLRQPWSFLS
jgi:hypothetical protein